LAVIHTPHPHYTRTHSKSTLSSVGCGPLVLFSSLLFSSPLRPPRTKIKLAGASLETSACMYHHMFVYLHTISTTLVGTVVGLMGSRSHLFVFTAPRANTHTFYPASIFDTFRANFSCDEASQFTVVMTVSVR
ncbi:unnamed protein product, partial [Ectocarpus sp. 13 AM-2016]